MVPPERVPESWDFFCPKNNRRKMFKKVESKVNLPELEENILSYWEKNSIFKKSVEGKVADNIFSFYDGPPFATGTPHYGHLLPGTVKDVIPRFRAMQGFRVERVWGWDTHGLPIENIVEQELDFKTKDQVQEYGIDRFNEKCRTKVLKYADEWKKIVARTGRWVDMENAYLTMDPAFMESVWWVFKNLWEKDLIYKGHKVMPFCPRCSTGLSNFEVGLAYADKSDKAVTVKFELENKPKTYVLAWTTTPWTLPGNLALSVGAEIDYVVVEKGDKKYILAQERLEDYTKELGTKVVQKLKGKDLVGKKYKPVFSYYKNPQRAFLVIAGKHVTTEDGTGIVHTAPAFGEEDYRVAKDNNIDFFMPVDDLGHFTIEVPEYSGKSVVEFETNNKIIEDLGEKVLKVEEINHSYPHCWRCDTPLIYKAIDSYMVAVEKIKKDIIANNKKIKWMPENIGRGRFAKLIEGAPDWNISRNRFWGTPLPVWICEKCKKLQVLGSKDELEKLVDKKVEDLHLHKLADLKIKCECGGYAKISGEVLDCWFESGSMPYGQMHYPFENKMKFDRSFPADFISESIDQTRGWFYSLLVLSTALFGKEAYKNVVVTGLILAESGQKMSKKLKNYPEVATVLSRYGADAMRFYLMSSPAVKSGDLAFSEKGVDEIVKSIILRLWNSYSFFVTYATLDNFVPTGDIDSKNQLDKWMISKTNNLVIKTTALLEKYDILKATNVLKDYIEELSNWYIRRSRKRFWKSENDSDKNAAYETLHYALVTYTKLLAPFMPFVTDEIYQNLTGQESVHLADWPKAETKFVENKLEVDMELVKKIVEAGLSARNEKGIKVRQPLTSILVTGPEVTGLNNELQNIICEEINLKKVMLKKGSAVNKKAIRQYTKSKNVVLDVQDVEFKSFIENPTLKVELDEKITPELKAEGIARDFIRFIQDGRKKAGFNVEDRIKTSWETKDKKVADAIKSQEKFIAKETLSAVFVAKKTKHTYGQEIKLDGAEVWFGISKK